jgi:multidrug efflux system outer membrane protein
MSGDAARKSACATLALILSLFAAGCAVGPNYKRPAVDAPPQFRGAAAGDAASLADRKWSDLFQDEALRQLVADALEHNFDLRIASERVIAARATFRISSAARFPNLIAQAGFTASRSSLIGANNEVPAGANLDVSYTQAGLALNWELDFWGRLRRLTQSARAQYLATEEGRRGVVVSLIADVTGSYFTLRERDLELEIARRTRDIAENNLKLVQMRYQRGAGTALDVHQAEQFLYIATAQIASTQRDVEQLENALSLLAGRAPGEIMRGKALDQVALPPEVPAGLPSSLLERRPDIRQAEQALIAANAQIGAAKALYFPQISLTGFLGGQSRALTDLFTGPARLWVGGPGAVLPVFNAGLVRAGVRLTEAQKREMVLAYQKAIYSSFREVSDALVGYSRTREQRAQEERLVTALSETNRLSELRYKGGLDSYLQVLDAERNLFQGQLTLAQLRLGETLSFVQLYRALGGGWQ